MRKPGFAFIPVSWWDGIYPLGSRPPPSPRRSVPVPSASLVLRPHCRSALLFVQGVHLTLSSPFLLFCPLAPFHRQSLTFCVQYSFLFLIWVISHKCAVFTAYFSLFLIQFPPRVPSPEVFLAPLFMISHHAVLSHCTQHQLSHFQLFSSPLPFSVFLPRFCPAGIINNSSHSVFASLPLWDPLPLSLFLTDVYRVWVTCAQPPFEPQPLLSDPNLRQALHTIACIPTRTEWYPFCAPGEIVLTAHHTCTSWNSTSVAFVSMFTGNISGLLYIVLI